ncbi:hypothetical protein CapIbe_008216 [Capra ibex]
MEQTAKSRGVFPRQAVMDWSAPHFFIPESGFTGDPRRKEVLKPKTGLPQRTFSRSRQPPQEKAIWKLSQSLPV